MSARRAVPAVLAGFVLAACSSPADVAKHRNDVLANNARALADNDAAMRTAEEWNTRVLGMPASGALSLGIAALIALVLIVVAVCVYFAHRNKERLRAEREGPCGVCGASVSMRRARESSG